MNRPMNGVAAAAIALAALLLSACSDDDAGADPATETAPAESETVSETSDEAGADHASSHSSQDATTLAPQVANDVAAMRAATAHYVNDLDAALDDGFFIITQHMPGMGYHFLNHDWSADGFDPNEPPILMYANDGDDWHLVGFEWVFPEEPDEPPMDGATYGDFPAACHYDDGLFVELGDEAECDDVHPESGAEFTFWHPDLVTLHVWAWLHNPDGLYHPTNPLMEAYD